MPRVKISNHRLKDAIHRSKTGLDNPGFCLECGEEAEGVEPDAEGYECEACGAEAVYGAEQILICQLFD